MGAFPACAAAVSKALRPTKFTKATPSSSIIRISAAVRTRPTWGCSRRFFTGANGSALPPTWRTRATSAALLPGSGSGTAREIYQEGLHLPPVKFMSRRKPVKEIDALITANSRTPDVVIGDLRGQVGAARLGERRIAELMDRYGKARLLESTELLSAYTENRVRQTIASWPDGESEEKASSTMTASIFTRPIRIHVKINKNGDQLHFDFSGSSDQTRARRIFARRWCAPPAPTVWSRWSIVFCRSIMVSLARSKRLFARAALSTRDFPAAVNTYMPTALAVAEAVLRALAHFVPEKRIAGGSGSAALVLGGRDANLPSEPLCITKFLAAAPARGRQRRRVGHCVSSEQLQNRADRNHRVGISRHGWSASR